MADDKKVGAMASAALTGRVDNSQDVGYVRLFLNRVTKIFKVMDWDVDIQIIPLDENNKIFQGACELCDRARVLGTSQAKHYSGDPTVRDMVDRLAKSMGYADKNIAAGGESLISSGRIPNPRISVGRASIPSVAESPKTAVDRLIRDGSIPDPRGGGRGSSRT